VPPLLIAHCIREAGVGFMFAPGHHPAMKNVGPTRVELGTRTIFNILGPLSNPAGVDRLLLGVFAKQWVEPIAHVMNRLGAKRVWVVHGNDGLDEITTTDVTDVAEVRDGAVRTFAIKPEDIGLPRAKPADLKGGDGAHNAAAIRAVLGGQKGAFRDIVVFNAAAALVVAGKAADLRAGRSLAEQSIDSGAARARLEKLAALTTAAG
jgi:anthranilate phosphoribosyltransferase